MNTVSNSAGLEQKKWTNAEMKLAVNLAFASRMLSRDGHDDLNQGQASARLPGQDRFLIKSALCGFNEARPSDMVFASIKAATTADRLAPPELPLHQAIYAARRDVNAIIHSHAPHTLVFGATDWELLPLSHDGSYFCGRVPRFSATSNTVLDIETAQSIAAVLDENPAVFLQNHGSVVVGRSLREAAVLAQVLERACRLQLLAAGSGAAYRVSSVEDVAKKRDYIYSETAVKSYWDYCVRLVKQLWKEAESW